MLQSTMSLKTDVYADTVIISSSSALADDKLQGFEIKSGFLSLYYKLSVCCFISRNIPSQWTQIK